MGDLLHLEPTIATNGDRNVKEEKLPLQLFDGQFTRILVSTAQMTSL